MFYPDWNQSINLYSALIILGGSLLLTLREFFPDTRMAYSKFSSDTKPGKTVRKGIPYFFFFFVNCLFTV